MDSQEQEDRLHAVLPGEIVIEIDEERVNEYETQMVDPTNPTKTMTKRRTVIAGNNNQLFFPLERVLRSRFEPKRFGRKYRLDDAVSDLDFVPGERIHINLEERTGRITDALADPNNKALREKCTIVAQEMQMPFFLICGKAETVKFVDDYQLWSWIFWTRRIVDMGCATEGARFCRPVQNVHKLPTYEDCVRSCKVPLYLNDQERRFMKPLAEERGKSDPNYNGESGRVTLTPYLAGIPAEKTATD